MDNIEFQKIAVLSANRYLDFLDSSNNLAGHSVNPVVRVLPSQDSNCYEFHLEDRVKENAQYLVFYRGRHVEDLVIVKAIGPRGRSRCVQVSDQYGFFRSSAKIFASDLSLVSDLRFLIKNIQDYHHQHRLLFSPNAPADLAPLPDALTAPFSDEQRTAYDTVFSSGFSYIHGAPGTGKTNMVLSRCILRYIQNKRRVFLLAPTNNALEQMLRGILPTFKALGIDLHKVYRLGMSSHEFAKEFPEVVGDPNTDNVLSDLRDSESQLQAKLDSIQLLVQAQEAEIKKHKADLAKLQNNGLRIIDLFQSLSSVASDRMQATAVVRQADLALADLENEHSVLTQDLQITQNQNALCCSRLRELERSLYSLFSLFWSKERKQAVSNSLLSLKQEQSRHNEEISTLQSRLQSNADALIKARHARSSASCNQEQMDIRIVELSNQLRQISEVSPQFATVINNALERSLFSIEIIHAIMDDAQAEFDAYQASLDSISPNEIQLQLDGIRTQITALKQSARQIQHERALVLAGTIDSSLRELGSSNIMSSTLPVSHVFLDEAGYTSIAKGSVAFSLGSPVTFFGDHNQLPPIMEKPHIDPSEQSLCIWALSCAYLPDLLEHGIPYLYHHCLAEKAVFSPPSFPKTSFSGLTKSYRFGQTLASILGQFIYGSGFQGLNEHEFEIVVIDAPFSGATMKRTSTAEVSAITQYILQSNPSDVAIMAPYNNQVNLIKRSLGPAYRDNVLTVHRSQGREWDTVVLSVTDQDDSYFTNSSLSIGRSVLCTAISRAKHKLVLVCDVAVWLRKQNQMITHLINYSTSHYTDDLPF